MLREPAVQGQFYPAQAKELKQDAKVMVVAMS